MTETDLFGMPIGQITEHVEYGEKLLDDSYLGKKGQVRGSLSGFDPYEGAYYAGGPKMFELVQRTVTTITGPWQVAS